MRAVSFGRQTPEPFPLDDERAMLQESRLALDRLKSELSERVAAVREREDELRRAIEDARNGIGHPTLAAAPAQAWTAADDDEDTAENALELERRARALDERERELEAREQELGTPELTTEARVVADEEREARIDARLAELKEAERQFLRTREELAACSEAVAARERLVAQRERELDDLVDAPKLDARELAALEARLARLERGERADEETQGFSGGFKRLQQSGTKQRPPSQA
jgi:flagellar hook-length control protein FliK